MDLLEEDPCLTLEELGESLQVDRSTVGKRLHAIGMVQKLGNWVPYELKDRGIERRRTMCELLLQGRNGRVFWTESLLVTKNGSIMIIQNADRHG